jgi:hypothetical protein
MRSKHIWRLSNKETESVGRGRTESKFNVAPSRANDLSRSAMATNELKDAREARQGRPARQVDLWRQVDVMADDPKESSRVSAGGESRTVVAEKTPAPKEAKA